MMRKIWLIPLLAILVAGGTLAACAPAPEAAVEEANEDDDAALGTQIAQQVAGTLTAVAVEAVTTEAVATEAPTEAPPTETPPPTETEVPPTGTPPPTETQAPTATATLARPVGRVSTLEGSIGGPEDRIQGELIGPDPHFLLRARVWDSQTGTDDGAGIETVTFTVSEDPSHSHPVWQRVEEFPAYCIFSGGDPHCNEWLVEEGVFLWPNGVPVESKTYHVRIVARTTDGEEGNWRFTLTFE